MIYPKELKPELSEIFQLSSHRRIEIPKANILFGQWLGEKFEDNYGGKDVINFNDEAVFAELAILRIFENNGWNGVWVDTFRKKYRIDWINKNGVELPSDKHLLLNKIYKTLGSKNGCWDIFCWKEERVIFAESKRRQKDKIRETQIKFLESALNCGLSKESFLIVEWTLA